jgi:hypothetical protein
MTLVFNVLTSPEGRPLQDLTVRFSLRAPGNPFTVLGSEVVQLHAEDTNTSGRWEADLIPNSQFEAAGTYYHVDERGGLREGSEWDFVVPDVGGPYWVRDLLVIPPSPGVPFPPVPPHALTDHTDVDTSGEVAGNVLRFDGTEWVPGVGGGGGGGSFEYFQDIQANEVTLNHGLGFRPAISLFSADWSEQYDEFAVQHMSVATAVISTGSLFRGWVVAS